MRHLLFLFFLAGRFGFAATGVTLVGPSLSPNLASVVVTVPKPRPPLASITSVSLWQVVTRQPGNPAGLLVPIASVGEASPDVPYTATGQVRIQFTASLAVVPMSLDVILALGTQPATVTWKPKKPGAAPTPFQDPFGFFPAANKAAADMYLSGSYATAGGSKPSYNIDAVIGSPVWIPGHVPSASQIDTRHYVVSITGTAATANEPKIDPDSFSAAVSLNRRYPMPLDDTGRSYFDFKWNAADWEFSRTNRAFNFISAPTLIYDVGGSALHADRTVAASVNLDLFASLEVGENLENKVVTGGYGGIVRFVPGAAVYFVFPKALGLKEIRFTSDYRDRILAQAEPFVDSRGAGRTYLTRGSRHHVSNTVTLQLTDIVGITLKHQYGSLPPSFKLVDNQFTIGVTALWSWKKKG